MKLFSLIATVGAQTALTWGKQDCATWSAWKSRDFPTATADAEQWIHFFTHEPWNTFDMCRDPSGAQVN